MRTLRDAVALTLCWLTAGSTLALEWPPADPNERTAPVAFTTAWAGGLRDLRAFRQLQEAAGARGKITQQVLDGDSPHVVFEWAAANGSGRMRANLYATGDFSAVVSLAGAGPDIVLNNFGAFVCSRCTPPVNACGHRPSWVPHDLHWDNFDCRCTLTGPQSLRAGSC